MTNEQKQAQAARCPCKGTDDYCPCQNVQQEPRFFIDHGVIHDRVTGKHVVTDGHPPFEDSVEQVRDLLNSLCAPTNAWCDLCGLGECLTVASPCPRRSLAIPSQNGNTP